MKFYSNLLCGAVFAAIISPAVANVATTAGSNLTAYNGTGAMNNNQWNSLMNGRAGMAQNTAEANFGNCNAIVLRCASPKCASGGCTDMNVAAAIVAGCVNSNQTCKQYGDDLVQYITAQVVAQSTAKVQQQQNAVEIARAQAEASAAASAAAAEQNNAQMVAMQQQMAQMQQQMADSMAAMQEQMAATAESQNAQIQSALESRATESPTYAGAPTAPIETGAVIAGLEGLGVAEQLAAKNGISTDILVREQMGGQIETAIEDATLKMKELKQTLDNIIEYAGCDPSVTKCTGPKRVKKFKDMANEFFDPYEEVLDNMYDALILAMTLGIDVSDTIMLLSGACNIWGKYLCDTCSYTQQNSIDSGEGICACNTTDNSGKGTNCYWRVRTDSGRVGKDQPHCRLVGTINSGDDVWHEWIDANSGITGTTQVACASDMIDTMSIFKGRRKKTSVDIDTLRDFINQDSYGVCHTSKNDKVDVLEDCGAKFCNVDPHNDTTRISQLRSAVSTKKLPTTNWCFKDENALKRFDGGGSSNNETGVSVAAQRWLLDRTVGCAAAKTATDCGSLRGCKWDTRLSRCVDNLVNEYAVCMGYSETQCKNDSRCHWDEDVWECERAGYGFSNTTSSASTTKTVTQTKSKPIPSATSGTSISIEESQCHVFDGTSYLCPSYCEYKNGLCSPKK